MNINNAHYLKEILINANIIYMRICRTTIDSVNGGIKYLNNKMVIPKTLDLPYFCFEDELSQKYELIGIVIYHFKKKKYSIIIKQNNNYYHYLNEGIIKVDEKYFDKIVNYNAYGVFYQQMQ
jgi:hypothetical protein